MITWIIGNNLNTLIKPIVKKMTNDVKSGVGFISPALGGVGFFTSLLLGEFLLSIIIDVERLGDYTKNILDLAINYDKKIISEDLLPELREIEVVIEKRFKKTLKAVNQQSEDRANLLLNTYEKDIALASDKIVNSCISGDLLLENNQISTAASLYSRSPNRVGAHLTYITPPITNPSEHIVHTHPSSN